MKRFGVFLLTLLLSGCGEAVPSQEPETIPQAWENAVEILLTDADVHVDGITAGEDPSTAVSVARDIIYYEDGKDFTYGEGTESDAHSTEEAAAHTVVHINAPGTYLLRGSLSAGQIAVDLGEDAEEDPSAVVTLILDGVDITCTVAPAIIFYSVYECGDQDHPAGDVDTSAAGANVIIADGSTNTVNGSYVARIYKPESVELNEDGTEVLDAKKLHKYDGAFYSRMSVNINGGKAGDGMLYIVAENEGLDSELHLTINGGNIDIRSGNDGINTNEDGVSVTTINGGNLSITVTGETGEGDGIDSNGWLVINGGTVTAAACSYSMDSGIDADMGIHINGGFVMASGNMLDRIEDGGQTYTVFQFVQQQSGGTACTLKADDGHLLATFTPVNDYSNLLISDDGLTEGNYTLWQGDTQLFHSGNGGMMGGFGGTEPGGPRVPPEWEDIDFSKLPQIPGEYKGHSGRGEKPEFPEGFEGPKDKLPERPDSMDSLTDTDMEKQPDFTINAGGNHFRVQ